jgi:hypothetical protein
LQVKPHTPLVLQVAVELVGCAQAVHDVVPQVLVLLSETQAPLQL